MKCVIALAVLAVALPAAFGAPRPGYYAAPALLRSADLLDGAVISAPAAVAIAPSSISSHSTVIAHPSPAIAYAAHPAPIAYAAHPAPIAYAAHPAPLAYSAYSAPVVAAAPAGKTTVIAGPSGTITESQGYGAVAYNAW